MSNRFWTNKEFLSDVSTTKSTKRTILIKKATAGELKAIAECIVNCENLEYSSSNRVKSTLKIFQKQKWADLPKLRRTILKYQLGVAKIIAIVIDRIVAEAFEKLGL